MRRRARTLAWISAVLACASRAGADDANGTCAWVTHLQSTTVVGHPGHGGPPHVVDGLVAPRAAAVTPDGRWMIAVEHGMFRVAFVDLHAGAVASRIRLVAGDRLADGREVAMAPDGRHAYVTQEFFSNVSIVDVATQSVVGVVEPGSRPRGVAVSPDGSLLYVANSAEASMAVIDPAARVRLARVPVGSIPYGVAVSPDGRRVYVANAGSSDVSVVDAASRTVVATVAVPGAPRWVAFDPAGSRAYVTLTYDAWGSFRPNDRLAVIDVASSALVGTIVVGPFPQNVEVGRDGRHAYVTCSGSQTLARVDLATGAVESAPTDAFPLGLALVESGLPTAAPTGGGVHPLGRTVVLGGQVSDPEGDPLRWEWRWGDSVLASGALPAGEPGAPRDLPEVAVASEDLGVGSHEVELVVADRCGRARATVAVEVVPPDVTAPELAPRASHAILWPADRRMVAVTILANATDDSGGPVHLDVSVRSDEPADGAGDGETAPDHEVVWVDSHLGAAHVDLRAERAGGGDGRAYTVTLTATDAAGNASVVDVEVRVPHDRR